MKSTLRGSIAGAAGSLVALAVAAVAAAGCGASSATAVRPAPPKGTAAAQAARAPRPAPLTEREAFAQRDAQRAWCNYLQALYLRGDATASVWPKFQECAAVKSTASPELLKHTADCSLHALEIFEGDPFTTAYAGEVSRCGAAALDAAAVTRVEVEPFVAALCSRAAACGEASLASCRASFDPGVVINLERAVGAMNRRSRDELRVCLREPSCEALPDRISSCLEPIMDGLLWLPSER